MTKSELKRKYKLLKHAGKDNEADILLKKIQSMKGVKSFDTENPKKAEKKLVLKQVKKKSLNNFDSIKNIKGVGNETVSDLKKIYNNLDELKIALKNDKVPLRNDVVVKLKKYFNF